MTHPTSPSRTRAAVGSVVTLLTVMAASLVAGQTWPMTTRAADPGSATVDYAEPGPYEVETREITVPRAGGDDDFEARLFVPLPPSDVSTPPDERSATYAFGHGYLSPVEPYESTLQHLASWGITVVAPRSGRALFPSHERFASDLLDALDAVAVAAADDDWTGMPMDTEARSVGGHSMGGGAAVLAASMDPSVRTVATLTAADTRTSAIEAARAVEAPMLLVAGSEDGITPVDDHQRPIFEAAAGPAQLRVLEGGGHCGFLDQADLIGLICGRPSMDADTQRAHGRAALAAWLRGEVMGDTDAVEAAWAPAEAGTITIEAKAAEPR